MNFQDQQKDSVQSLLAQLRAAQDGGPGPGDSNGAGPSRPKTVSQGAKETSSINGQSSTSTSATPFSRQLGDLLSSLGKGDTTPAQPALAVPVSAFTGSSRNLIAPFGPITTKPASTQRPTPQSPSKEDEAEMSYTKALPLISALLEDEEFRQEVRRMKVDQDTLERRLWAKGEKVRGEHEKTTRTDKEIITGKEISPAKQKEWANQLEISLQEFYRQTCLPSIDGQAARHRERLQALGVPGLGMGGGRDDTRARERVRKIMDVIESGLDD